MTFLTLTAIASVLAGAVASVAGFGIGSLLTPLMNTRHDIRLSVAAVSIPHVVATAVRLWVMRRDIDRQVLKSFGVMSAAGGLAGALAQQYAQTTGLTLLFGGVVTFAGFLALTGLSDRIRLGRTAGAIAGIASGALGGLVGNQGGIRSAALFGYDLSPAAFVATATAAGLIVDAARVPIYVAAEGQRLAGMAQEIGVATAGAAIGTLVGRRVLVALPPRVFRQAVGALVLILGLYMLSQA